MLIINISQARGESRKVSLLNDKRKMTTTKKLLRAVREVDGANNNRGK